MDISLLKINPSNPRTIKDDKFKKLVQSVKEFPEMLEKRPIVVNKEMIVLGGNMRLKACIEAGLKEVPVIVADWSEERQREFIIKDNVSGGEWDWDVLANEWDTNQLTDWGLDIPDFVTKEVQEDYFEIPDEIQTDIILGDFFEIGQHILLCGDSTEADAVSKLLQWKEPYLMVTDPPYGVNYDADWRNHAARFSEGMGNRKIGAGAIGRVSNDDNPDWSQTWALSPSKVAYIWHAGKYASIVENSLTVNNFEIRSQIIWNKNHFAISRGDYHWQHEPCWYAVKKGSVGNWAGDRRQSTVWEIDKPQASETGHSTQKPVECMWRPINNHDGDVYDPFLGSGTTMVAAHQLNRKCYGMEIDPKYCQIIIDRMRKLDPNIEIKLNGVHYSETTANAES